MLVGTLCPIGRSLLILFKRLFFICLLCFFAVGCASTDKQKPQLNSQTDTIKEAKNLAKKPESNADTPQILAFAPVDSAKEQSSSIRAEVEEYHLPHATQETNLLIKRYAKAYDIPERLVRRVVRRESHGNPLARNGPYWGLMQISYPTAQGMGYQGKPEGLLDAETNLKYAVKYLAGAYLVAGGDETQSVRLYARGFYYDAKAKGLLERTGLRPGPTSIMTAFADE